MAENMSDRGGSFDVGEVVQRANQPEAIGIIREIRWDEQVERPLIVYNDAWTYAPEGGMSNVALTRTSLLLEAAKVRRLRKALGSPSNSAAVRRAIDERLAVEAGLQALRDLRRLGGPEDVFGRAATNGR
jgi:hypothetical protein